MELSTEGLRGFFETVLPHLNEKQRRVVAGAMVVALGRGGQARVAEASGLSSSTVNTATQAVRAGIEPTQRQRVAGAGKKPSIATQPGLLEALDELVHPSTRGTPMSALRWTLKSTYELAGDLQARGFRVSAELVRRLLHQMGSRCKHRPSRTKVRRTPTVTASSATSTARPPSGSQRASRWCRWTPRRRS